MGRWNENVFDKARGPVVENLYARGDAYSPSRYRLAIPEKSPIRVHPCFPSALAGEAEGGTLLFAPAVPG